MSPVRCFLDAAIVLILSNVFLHPCLSYSRSNFSDFVSFLRHIHLIRFLFSVSPMHKVTKRDNLYNEERRLRTDFTMEIVVIIHYVYPSFCCIEWPPRGKRFDLIFNGIIYSTLFDCSSCFTWNNIVPPRNKINCTLHCTVVHTNNYHHIIVKIQLIYSF